MRDAPDAGAGTENEIVQSDHSWEGSLRVGDRLTERLLRLDLAHRHFSRMDELVLVEHAK
ncbi:Uu.00g000160.m01.CDS01 [Anthostomella pinea]|uniref:Uu.00g000160.m01.CDS01 n=1 Tax=Anthostomella pinea TaxID=933095 RepID=A0AAI8VJR7_9PEZI|nr:Uu.00g000160.m01.CDS01 [Anthostomella pinea]